MPKQVPLTRSTNEHMVIKGHLTPIEDVPASILNDPEPFQSLHDETLELQHIQRICTRLTRGVLRFDHG